MELKISKEEKLRVSKEIGKSRAQSELYYRYYLDKYKINPELLGEKWVDKLSELEEMKNNYDNLNTWYIVVNPNPELMNNENEFKEFIDKCFDAQRKKWIHTCKLWFEFRDNTKKSIHANFAITKSKYAPSRVKGEFWNSFKKWCGNKLHINVQRSRDSEFLDICAYQYNDKKKNVIRDQLMLKMHNLCDNYMYESKSSKKDSKWLSE